jgi:hypothetical protein
MIRRNAAALAALLLASASILAQAPSTATASSAAEEAAKMVPATAVFLSNVDSQKLKAGTPVKVKLQKEVRLANGPALPGGTVLVGQVVDDTAATGKAKLALRFTEAELKGGQTVPVKVTIFGLFQLPSDTAVTDNFSAPRPWDKQSLGVNQADVAPGIDLQSTIESPNSGVFVSTKKDAVKTSGDHGISFAIAARSSAADQNAYGY